MSGDDAPTHYELAMDAMRLANNASPAFGGTSEVVALHYLLRGLIHAALQISSDLQEVVSAWT